ncbi:MAG: UvrD-helicase domain-containing protein [Bacilli bacterium]
MKATKEQEKAIVTEGNLIVSAGAGSGKTSVLSERVLYFIKEKGFHIKEFLIVTFTTLAAAEMKERIRKVLKENNLEDANDVDVSQISTFDSYAFSIVKKYHFKLGLPANVSIIDENILGVKFRLKAKEKLEDLYLKKDDEVFNNLIKMTCVNDDSIIENLLYKIYKYFCLEINPLDAMNSYVEEHTSEEFIENTITNTILDKIFEVRKKMVDLIPYLSEDPIKKNSQDTYKDLITSSFSEFFNVPKDYDKVINSFPREFPIKQIKAVNGKEETKAFKIIYKKDKKKGLLPYIESLPQTKSDFIASIQNQKPYFSKLVDIVKEIYLELLDFKKEYNVYAFDDIQRMALNLIIENEDIREEIKQSYKMIMIDEYQDTSTVQDTFINLIANNNLYVVGDIKQSIYRFRNARCELFKQRYDRYKNTSEGEVVDMNTNFRSRKEVLEPINDIFSIIMNEETSSINYKKDHIINVGNKSYLDYTVEDNTLEIITTFNDVTKPDSTKYEVYAIANDIIKKINDGYQVVEKGKDGLVSRKCEFRDFCILISKSETFNDYYSIFNQFNIPLYIEKNLNIVSNDLVAILLSVLKLVKNIKDNTYDSLEFKHAFISLARSFVYQYSDEKIYNLTKNKDYFSDDIVIEIKTFLEKHQYDNDASLFENLIFELSIYKKILRIGNVKTNSTYLDVIISYFKDMCKLGYTFNEFIIFLETLDDYKLSIEVPPNKDSSNCVRIMTIHKSKGLEFPIVYFPELWRNFNKEAIKSKFGISRFGIALPPSSTEDKLNLIHECFSIEEVKANLAEQIRLLYVALTRAREKIVFLNHIDKKCEVNETEIEQEETVNEETNNEDNNEILPSISSFLQLLEIGLKNTDFTSNYFDYTAAGIPELNQNHSEVIEEKFEYIPLNIDVKPVEYKHGSKEVDLETNVETMQFGTKLHEYMELVDFDSKDLSFIKDESIKRFISKFINCDLFVNISLGKVYKEFEYFDNLNKISGIIDLMVEYSDYIDVIDYKTSNIDDEEYNVQVQTYMDYIRRTFNKPTNGYLYSLKKGIYRKV